MTVPFVGRRAELAALRGLISAASRDGAPVVGLVTGEAGAGKSRLLRELATDLDPRRRVDLTGFEPTASIPLAAAAELLRRLASVPGHGPRLGDLAFGERSHSPAAALQVFEAANRAIAAAGPLVVVVDDLQWVDPQSVALLHYLVNAAESAKRPLAVVAASRTSPTATSFADGVVKPRGEGRGLSIEIGGLDLEAGVALARAIDGDLEPASAEALWRRAAGNTFWIEALARVRVPGSGGDPVVDRLRTLGSDAGRLVELLAIGARPFSPDDLAELARWTPNRLDAAIRELVARGLAIDERGHVRLAHDLIREAAVRAMPGSIATQTHRRLAELLERTRGDDLRLLAEAVEHRRAAGLPTAELAIRLVASPQRRLLGEADLRRLSAIASDLAPGSAEQLQLDRGLGRLAGVLGFQELALQHAVRRAAHQPDASGRQDAALDAALAAYRLGLAAEAHAHLERARSAAAPSPESTARVEALEAEIALWLDHDPRAGARAAQSALGAARTMAAAAGGPDRLPTEPRRVYVAALEASIGAAMQEERFDDVRSLTGEILPAARALDDETYVAALLRSGFALRPLGAIHEAERVYREAWELAHRAVLPFPMIDAGIGLGRVLRDLGRLGESLEVTRETVDLETRLGSPPGRWGNASASLHATELSLGEPQALERLRADAQTHPNPHFRMWIHQLIAIWLARLDPGRSAPVIELSLAAGRADSALAGCPRCGGELVAVAVEALARLGRVAEARRELAGWEARGIREYPWQGLLRARAEASIAMAEGGGAAAVPALVDLCGKLADAELLDDLVWARLDLGAAQAGHDRDAAVAAYSSAADLATRIGATSRRRLADKALRRLGVRAWRRGPAGTVAGPADLSPREAEIAGLAGGGATNAEIAEALAISQKTVERHITNTLAKLGARNRTELAARLRGGTGIPR